MIGCSKEVEQQLAAYPREAVENWFNRHGCVGEIRLRYARNAEATDITSFLPSSRHMYYVAKGWTAVEIDPASIPRITTGGKA